MAYWDNSLPYLYASPQLRQPTFQQVCAILDRYYLSNGLYQQIESELRSNGAWDEGIKPLRNPVYRAVEFFVSRVWPGNTDKSFPIVTKNERLLEPIVNLHKWSNWAINKDLCVRRSTLLGNVFIKVYTHNKKVILQPLEPSGVIYVKHDARGNLTKIRIDSTDEEFYYVEIWDLSLGTARFWEFDVDTGFVEDDSLAAPTRTLSLKGDLKIDFIPISHGKLFDLGKEWGVPVVWAAMDKIDELNRMVSTLHSRLFRYGKPTLAISSTSKGDVRPVAQPNIVRKTLEALIGNVPLDYDTERLITLPPDSKIEQLVAQLPYDDILKIVESQMQDIAQDLPELKYAALTEKGGVILSGVAIKLLLADTIDRVLQIRAVFDDCLIRAHKMAFTIGMAHGIFENLGSFDDMDFEHDFAEREVIAIPVSEKALTTEVRVRSGVPLVLALEWEGVPEELIAKVQELLDIAEEKENAKLEAEAKEKALTSQNKRVSATAEGSNLRESTKAVAETNQSQT